MIPFSALPKSVRQAGFTLFEIMVTVLLAGLMMTGAFYFLIDFTRSWDQDTSDLELQRQGNYALTVMEARMKQCDRFTIANFGGGTNNEITITLPNPTGGTRNFVYRQNGTAVEENNVQASTVTTIIPDTHVAGIAVSALTFTDELITGQPGRSVRIDLALQDASGQTADFTTTVRLRNQELAQP
jgi:prepilin-type N-terminal cleavage/methylation domain-containing protein